MTTLVLSNQTLVSPLPEVAQERDRCFDAITREFCPSGFVENLLALQAARDAARILRDERLLDALEARSITALAPVVGADPSNAEALLEDFPEVYVSKPSGTSRLGGLTETRSLFMQTCDACGKHRPSGF